MRVGQVKKYFSDNGHITPANGTATQNRDYCSKDGDFIEYGQCPLSGPQKIASDWEGKYFLFFTFLIFRRGSSRQGGAS